jgi:succinate dehydrogenase/fumarate reductase flavoprotein subunit
MEKITWPYELKYDEQNKYECEVLVLGGGISGSMAAISAVKEGKKVILVEKGAVRASGAGGSGCDHWESAATNPNSKITPLELVNAMLDDNDGFNNGISHFIECQEGYGTLLEIEKMGGKIRDDKDEYLGAFFRDENTKLMYAYDYKSKFTLRIWGSTFKSAMHKELKRLGVILVERTMITSLIKN